MRSGGRQRTASARSARCTPGRAPHGPACPQRGGPRLHGAGSAPSPPDLFALVRSYEPPFRSHFGRAPELRAPYYRAIFHPPCRNSPPPLAPPPPPPAPRSGPPHLTGAILPPRGLSTSAPSSDACAARSASRTRRAKGNSVSRRVLSVRHADAVARAADAERLQPGPLHALDAEAVSGCDRAAQRVQALGDGDQGVGDAVISGGHSSRSFRVGGQIRPDRRVLPPQRVSVARRLQLAAHEGRDGGQHAGTTRVLFDRALEPAVPQRLRAFGAMALAALHLHLHQPQPLAQRVPLTRRHRSRPPASTRRCALVGPRSAAPRRRPSGRRSAPGCPTARPARRPIARPWSVRVARSRERRSGTVGCDCASPPAPRRDAAARRGRPCRAGSPSGSRSRTGTHACGTPALAP